MKKLLIVMHLLLLGALLVAVPARGQGEPPWPEDAAAQTGDELYTPEELDDLLAPVALYPDPLLAQILPAATFVDQIDAAARYVRLYGNAARIDEQPWDVSVRAVAYYPEVLFMMDRKYDWTVALGQAYLNQPDDVMEAIQRLRLRAQEMGNLYSTPQQTVIVEGGYIRIVPAQSAVIYVPEYDPLLVYWERPYPDYGFITFGIGFTIGVWLNRDCDWHRHRIYYHGWRGGGWIGRARSHVNLHSKAYLGDRFRRIDVNRRVRRYDTRQYRNVIRRDVQFRRERGGWNPPPSRRGGVTAPSPPGGRERREQTLQPRSGQQPPSRHEAPMPSPRPQERGERQLPRRVQPPVPSIPRESPPPVRIQERGSQFPPSGGVTRPARPESERYRGRETGVSVPAPSSGYGGYGNRRELPVYRERGERSREQMRQFFPRQPVAPPLRTAPAPFRQPGVSGGRPPAPQQMENRPVDRGGSEWRGEQRGGERRGR